MLQNRNQMDASGTQPLYRLAVSILLKYKMNEFTDAVLLLASVTICEDKLNILFEDKDVSLRQLISLLEKEIEKEAVSLSELYTEGLSKINHRGFVRLTRYAIDNPLYPDQIACGPLYFLYSLLVGLEEKDLLIKYNLDKKLWINTLKNSSELFLEAHTKTMRELEKGEIEYLRTQLSSIQVLTRFLAGISLNHLDEYQEEIIRSFAEIIGDEKSDCELDWSGVSPEVKSNVLQLVRGIVNSEI